MFTFASNTYPGGFGASYNYCRRPNSHSLRCGNSYYGALAEAHSIESEILAQEAILREEEVLERRLQELRRSRLTPQSYSYDPTPYRRCLPDDWSHQPPDNFFRLRIAEEEQIAKLEALRQRRYELEAKEKLKVVAELRHRKLEAEELARHEKARRLHELAITEEEEKIKRLLQGQRFAKAMNALEPTVQPASLRNSLHRPQDALELIVELVRDTPASAKESAKKADIPSTLSFRPSKKQSSTLSTSPKPIELIDLFRQLGLMTKNEEKPVPKKEERRPVQQPIRSPSQLGANAKHSVSSESTLQAKREEGKSSPLPKDSVLASPEVTLKEQLERRLEGEYTNEVRDTILALLNSLSDVETTTSGVSSKSQASSSFSKGKAKASEPAMESASLVPNNVKNIMGHVREIESHFHALEKEFEFPGKLDFIPSSPPTTPQTTMPTPVTSQLAHTATNQPIRYYEQALSSLLTQLDSIESYGSEELRSKRKDVVRKVENALEDLEQRVEVRWKTTKRRSVSVEDVTAADEHLMTPERASVPLVSEDIQRAGETLEPVTPSQQSEAPASAVEEFAGSIVGEVPVPTIFHSKYATTETADRNQPVSEQTQLIQDELLEVAPVSAPAGELPRVSESLVNTALESVLFEGRTSAQVVQPSSETPDTPLASQSAESESPTDHSPTASLLERSASPATGLQDVTPGPDLAATIRPIGYVASADKSPSPAALGLPEIESDFSETETEGLLLENGVVEASHDISDNESTSSDWSEVDGIVSH